MSRIDPRTARSRRHDRVRQRVVGTSDRPRLCIYRSLKHIYAQVIDDSNGYTLVAASTLEPAIKSQLNGGSKVDSASVAGKQLAQKAIEHGIRTVVFDRGGYKYHGRVKAFAEAAREAGLEF